MKNILFRYNTIQLQYNSFVPQAFSYMYLGGYLKTDLDPKISLKSLLNEIEIESQANLS